MIPKQTIKFRFGSADTDTGDKHIKQGDIVKAQNVRMTAKRGEHDKRPGFTVTQTTFSGGSFSGPATDIVDSPGGGTLFRDNADQLWAESGGVANYIGANPRPWPTSSVLVPAELSICRPRSCIVGTNTWFFTCNNAASSYWLTIVDTVTGTTVLAPILVTATANPRNLAPVYDGTNVWVFYVAGATIVYAHKFVAATPSTAPTGYTYTTTTSATYSTLDAKYMPGANGGAGRTYVVYAGGINGGTANRTRGYSYLNTATGAATSETVTNLAISAALQSPCVYILENQDGSAASWYFVYGGQQIGSTTQSVILFKVSSSAWTSTNSLITTAWPNGPNIGSTSTASAEYHSVVTGYCQDATTQVVFSQSWASTSGSTEYWRNDTLSIFKSTFNAGAWNSDCAKVATGSWIASGPWTMGGRWYFLTGFDDGMVPMTTGRQLQQAYHVRDSSGVIFAQVFPGEGAGAFHVEASPTSAVIYMCVPRPQVSGNVVQIPFTTSSSNISYCAGSLLRIDYAKKYGKATSLLGRAIVPGPVPQAWSSYGTHELAPMLFPSWITAGGGTPLATAIAIRYVITDPDGTLWRGAPTILVQGMAAAAQVYYPTLRHLLPGTTAKVEIYLANTSSTTPYLQTTVANNPAVDQQLYTVPAAVSLGESLDTIGGALGQAWPMPAQAATVWRNRLVLAHQNHIHYSKEMEYGFGPLFNEALTAIWSEAAGMDIIALCAVNYDYLGAFCSGRIAVINGPGPDGAGRGNYTVMPISTMAGTVAPRSVVQGPDGCYFFDSTAQRLCLLTTSLQVKDIEGVSREAFTATESASGTWFEQQRSMVWLGDSKQLVLDYGNRTESCPLGRMYTWYLLGISSVPSAATIVNGGIVAIDNDGDIHRSNDPTSTYRADTVRGVEYHILRRMRTAWLQPDDLQGEFAVSWVKLIFKWFEDCPINIRLYANYFEGPPTLYSKSFTITSANQQVGFRPPGCGRVQSIAVEIYDTTPAAGVTRGAIFEGVAMEIQLRGRSKSLESGQVL
jgi:hypothetical protein